MTAKVTVPELGESILEATVGEWHKQEGDMVSIGDVLVDLETDKVDVEVGAETAGVLVSIEQETGEDVQIGDLLAKIDPDRTTPAGEKAAPETREGKDDEEAAQQPPVTSEPQAEDKASVTPVAQRLADEQGVDLTQVEGSGANGRITRQDVQSYLKERKATETDQKTAEEEDVVQPSSAEGESKGSRDRLEERVRLTRRRRTIAQRLVTAQQTAASLTTFNDVDMTAVINLRERRGDDFRERHGVKLGFMSFFVKAAVGALKSFPRVNAEIDGEEMVLKRYYDIGMAVGAEEGLVVPVVRDADRKSLAEIEREIRDLAQKARDGSLALEDLRGGTFTITNGGVFGSLLSTPILNPPQVGILGLHRIEDRPIAVDEQVVIRPMMYMALSYDHRLIDGREAVQFLTRVKELIEEPEILLLDV